MPRHVTIACTLLLLFLHTATAAPQLPSRFNVLPDAADAVAALIQQLDKGEVPAAVWHDLYRDHGSDTLRLLIVLSREEPYAKQIQAAFELYLQTVSSRDTIMAAKQLSTPDYQRLLYLLDMLTLAEFDRHACLTIIRILNDLEEYARAYDFGHRAWIKYRHITIMGHTMRAVREGKLVNRVWEQAGEKLFDHGSDNYVAMEICFYAEVARALHQPHAIRSLLRIAELSDVNPNLMAFLCERLARLELRDEIDDLLQGSANPMLAYLRIHYVEQREPNEAEWARIREHANTPLKAAVLAETLTQQKSPAAADAWHRVLAFEEEASTYTRDAYLRLGQLAEQQADYEAAADYLQKALHTLDPEDEQENAHRKRLAHHITDLRRQATAGRDSYQRRIQLARHAMQQGDYDQAETFCRDAIRRDPTRFTAHSLLFSIYKMRHEFDRLPMAAAVISRLEPQDTMERLTKSFQLTDVGRLDKALQLADQVIEAMPDDHRGYLAKANALERKAEYEQALQALEMAQTHDASPRIHRLRGLVLAKQGKLEEAVAAFDRFLREDEEPYVRLWRYLLQARLGHPDTADLQAALSHDPTPDDRWILELYRYCLGQYNTDELMAAAQVPDDPNLTRGHECEAWFYIGLQHLAQNQPRAARRALETCLGYKINVYIETPWAQAELSRLAK